MDKKLKLYYWSKIIFITLSFVCLCWFFYTATANPSNIGFITSDFNQIKSLSPNYNYVIESHTTEYLNNDLIDVNYSVNIILSAQGIISIIFLTLLIFATIFEWTMIGINKIWKANILYLIIANLMIIAILYLFSLSNQIPNLKAIIDLSYWNWFKTNVVSNQTITIETKLNYLQKYVDFFKLNQIEDNSSMLISIQNHSVFSNNIYFNDTYTHSNGGFNQTNLIYFTYTFASLMMIIAFVYYLTISIKMTALVNDNWKIPKIKFKPIIKKKKNDLNLNQRAAKKKAKSTISAPDPQLEEIFRELDL